jgi:hypothetical protein
MDLIITIIVLVLWLYPTVDVIVHHRKKVKRAKNIKKIKNEKK